MPAGRCDDGVNHALFQQLPADFPFGVAAEEDAVRRDDAHGSRGLQVIKTVQKEGVVGL